MNNRTKRRLYYWILLDYEYVKNNYALIVVDLSRKKELDTDPKAIQQIEFVR